MDCHNLGHPNVHLLPLYLTKRTQIPFPKTIKNCWKSCEFLTINNVTNKTRVLKASLKYEMKKKPNWIAFHTLGPPREVRRPRLLSNLDFAVINAAVAAAAATVRRWFVRRCGGRACQVFTVAALCILHIKKCFLTVTCIINQRLKQLYQHFSLLEILLIKFTSTFFSTSLSWNWWYRSFLRWPYKSLLHLKILSNVKTKANSF